MRDERHWLIHRLRGWRQRPALVWRDKAWSYDQLCESTDAWLDELIRRDIHPGSTLAICGDYSPSLCALLIAALRNRNIVVPLAAGTARRWDHMMEVAEVEFSAEFADDDSRQIAARGRKIA